MARGPASSPTGRVAEVRWCSAFHACRRVSLDAKSTLHNWSTVLSSNWHLLTFQLTALLRPQSELPSNSQVCLPLRSLSELGPVPEATLRGSESLMRRLVRELAVALSNWNVREGGRSIKPTVGCSGALKGPIEKHDVHYSSLRQRTFSD